MRTVRIIRVIFADGSAQTEQLGRDDSLSDFFKNHGIDLVAPWTNVKQILFFGSLSLGWEDITSDWVE